MSRQYSPKTFLRQVRGPLLNKCLRRRGIDLDLNLEIIKPSVVDELFRRLMSLPLEQLRLVESDFAAITELASGDGTEAILKEARSHGLNLATIFAQARNDYERACWAYLEHPAVFELAAAFHELDRIGAGRWHRRVVGAGLTIGTGPAAIAALQEQMRRSYAKEGRGRFCHIDYYRRSEPLRHCFFAYPEDHPRTDLAYDEAGRLGQRLRKAAFEVVFVYRPEEGVLEVMAPGGRERVEDLAAAFCTMVLGLPDLPAQATPQRYDLDALKLPGLELPTDPTDGIERVDVREVWLKLPRKHDWTRRLTLSAAPHLHDFSHLHSLIAEATAQAGMAIDGVTINRVKLTLLFAARDGGRPKRLTFEVGLPDYCTLKDTAHGQIARKYLHRWGFTVDGHPAVAAA